MGKLWKECKCSKNLYFRTTFKNIKSIQSKTTLCK